MKIIIFKDLVYSESNCAPGKYNYSGEILSQYSVSHKIIRIGNTLTYTVFAQKIVLDEISMNDLFCNCFDIFNYGLRYMALGGHGCEFTLELTQK